jgi:hypothetical protein
VIFAVPSKGRAHRTTTQDVLPSAVFFVPESESQDYADAGIRNIRAVPSEVVGITATRNWILDNVESLRVVMIDDDVKTQGWRKLHDRSSEHRPGNEAFWTAESRKLFQITQQMGFRIWGVSTVSALRAIYPYKPFNFRSYITASFMGIWNDGRTRFDERFPVKEDYELCLRCVVEDGGVLAARYLYWENEHWTTPGGCADYRTREIEEKAIKDLQNLYPGMVRQKDSGGSEFCIDIL